MNIRLYIALSLLLLLGACGKPSLTEEERAFVKALQEQLQNLGDSDRVQDIHSGEWLEVCVNPLGANGNIESKFIEDVAIRGNEAVTIKNGTDTFADDNIWGLYFVYPDNVIEYYNIPSFEIMIKAPPGGCAPRDTARLEVVANTKNRADAGLPANGSYSEKFVYLHLVP